MFNTNQGLNKTAVIKQTIFWNALLETIYCDSHLAEMFFSTLNCMPNDGVSMLIHLAFLLPSMYLLVPFHNYFPPPPPPPPPPTSSEQPEQRMSMSAHKSEQPTVVCIATFNKYCCYIKYGCIITNLTLWNTQGYVTDASKYHIADIRSMD